MEGGVDNGLALAVYMFWIRKIFRELIISVL
jgi:hypothetical protein